MSEILFSITNLYAFVHHDSFHFKKKVAHCYTLTIRALKSLMNEKIRLLSDINENIIILWMYATNLKSTPPKIDNIFPILLYY